MATAIEWVKRPAPTADHRATTRHLTVGVVLGLVGVAAVLVALIANVDAATILGTDPAGAAGILPWSFGLATGGLGLLKLGIAVILVGIVVRLWLRVDSVKAALPRLKAEPRTATAPPTGEIETDFGPATATASAPEPLKIHRVAQAMWLPMLVMGAMALAVGVALGFVTAGQAADTTAHRQLLAWTEGTAFLGEGLILAGIALLLGTILAGLRAGGGEVQQHLGVSVKTLTMPASAKAFVALMMAGVAAAVGQFVLYGVAAASAADATAFAAWTAWLGPLREVALGTILAGIVLALYTISKVLAFQFHRIRELMTVGH